MSNPHLGIIPLPEFKAKNNCYYKLVRRTDRTALYAVSYMPPECRDYRATGFDVYKIKIDPPAVFHGSHLPEREHFPSGEEFGRIAWSFQTLEAAAEKFKEIENTYLKEAA
jgi:hypothetical protein